MVGTWLLELYLDQLNRCLLEVKGHPAELEVKEQPHGASEAANGDVKGLPAPDQLTQDLRAFLKRNVNVLDVNVTVSLLAGYGRLDDLMEYATYRKVIVTLQVCSQYQHRLQAAVTCTGLSCYHHMCLAACDVPGLIMSDPNCSVKGAQGSS